MNVDKRLVQRVGMILCAASALCFWNVSAAAATERQPTDDEFYCRFFEHDIVGTVEHVEALTGVAGFLWYSDERDAYYFFTWRPEVGVVLEFSRDDGQLNVMKGSIGFDPQVNYWECDAATSGN
jgi:hypothetical protein